MTAKIKIPKGWRKLRKGAIVRATDKYYVPALQKWNRANSVIRFSGDVVGQNYGDLDVQPWIRRIRKTAKGKK